MCVCPLVYPHTGLCREQDSKSFCTLSRVPGHPPMWCCRTGSEGQRTLVSLWLVPQPASFLSLVGEPLCCVRGNWEDLRNWGKTQQTIKRIRKPLSVLSPHLVSLPLTRSTPSPSLLPPPLPPSPPLLLSSPQFSWRPRDMEVSLNES